MSHNEDLINIEFGEHGQKAVTIIIDKSLLQTVINAWVSNLLAQLASSSISGAFASK